MKRIVLITGDLAAGKSTLADNLSKSLSFTCIKKDCVKEIICDSVGFTSRQENRNISIATVNSMIYVLEQTLKIGGDLILEANFRLSEITRIREIVKEYGGELSIVYLTGDEELLYKRFLARVPTRHRAHLSQGLDKDYNKFINYITELRNEIKDLDSYKLDISKLNELEVRDSVLSFLTRKSKG